MTDTAALVLRGLLDEGRRADYYLCGCKWLENKGKFDGVFTNNWDSRLHSPGLKVVADKLLWHYHMLVASGRAVCVCRQVHPCMGICPWLAVAGMQLAHV